MCILLYNNAVYLFTVIDSHGDKCVSINTNISGFSFSIIPFIHVLDFHPLMFQHNNFREWNMSYLGLHRCLSVLYDNCCGICSSYNTAEADATTVDKGV